ncbi:MAG: flavodoxin family protein [Methanogenium sp.]|nr:flavodoxin family protein [Methanogenium sp.]
MAIKVLGISGSPNRHGNTETLLDYFLDGAESAGGVCDKVILKKLRHQSCIGCNKCHKTGICVLKDDFTPLFEEITETDILALASPIYSMGITAELKALIDRGQYLWARKFILKDLYHDYDFIKRHKGLFLSTAGQDWDYVFDGAYPVVTAFFNDCGFEYYDNIIANNMDRYGGIHGHPDALDEAYEKGKEVVRNLEKILSEE